MENFDIKSLLRPNIAQLTPYSTARDECKMKLGVFLDANESPYENGYNRYPDPRQNELKAHISRIKGIAPANIFAGNGSDEAIDLVFRLFCRPGIDNILAMNPSYGMYEVSAAINDVEVREFNLTEDFCLPSVSEILSKADANTKAIFLCSPNNPSGGAFDPEVLLAIASSFQGITVVDEAYIDFSSKPSLLGRLAGYPRLMILQTMSKARGMAGLRLGLAFASEQIISYMNRVKYPYNISKAAQETALQFIDEDISARVEEIKSERARIIPILESLPFVEKVFPSDANFVLARVNDADALYAHLIADGIIVRNRTHIYGCKNCLRITIGLKEENLKLTESLSTYKY